MTLVPAARGNSDEPTNYFEPNSLSRRFDAKLGLDRYLVYSMDALGKVSGFDTDIHRYDSRADLVRSVATKSLECSLSGSSVNWSQTDGHSDCIRQLDWINGEAQLVLSNENTFASSKQLNLLDLLDSFGAPESQLMMGNNWWLGSFQQCSQAQLPDELRSEDNRTRYCIAKLRPPTWNKRNEYIKLAVCLPKACNSILAAEILQPLERLIKLTRLSQPRFANFKLVDLYCLPDEDSPLRKLSYSASIFVYLLLTWLCLVAFYSLKFEYLQVARLRSGEFNSNEPEGLMDALAIRLAWRRLFDIKPQDRSTTSFSKSAKRRSKRSLTAKEKLSGSDSAIDCDSNENSDLDLSSSPTKVNQTEVTKQLRSNLVGSLCLSGQQEAKSSADHFVLMTRGEKLQKMVEQKISNQAINLSVIDGIKVISMVWLVAAHSLLYLIRSISNGRDFWLILRDARFLTVMAGIFPVDSFFTVTGILTTCLRFNKGQHESSFSSSRYWLEAIYHRYVRFMPMYLMVFWYTRDVSEYIGSGPMWDYATANSSIRSTCKRESFTDALLFKANFKPLLDHCVKPAWYLASDFQFLLVTPIYLILLAKSERLGKLAIQISIALSLVLQFMTVFWSNEIDDFTTLINFKPMFGAYVLHNLWKLYVLPYNRICPYFIGLLTGYLMYRRDSNRDQNGANLITNSESEDLNAPEISPTPSFWQTLRRYICLDVWIPLICLSSIIYLPLLSLINTYDGIIAKIGTSAIIGLMRFVWSLSVARLIYVCTSSNQQACSSFMRRFLSSAQWKPWSKIGLSTLLIQWEVISYLAQTQTSLPNMTLPFLLSMILVSAVATYAIAVVVYITIEYPISMLEQRYIHPVIFAKR